MRAVCVVCGAITTNTRPARCDQHQLRSARNNGSSHKWRKIRAQIIERDQCCRRCGSTQRLEVHHLIPVSQGGSDDPNNLVTSCFSCHRGKRGTR